MTDDQIYNLLIGITSAVIGGFVPIIWKYAFANPNKEKQERAKSNLFIDGILLIIGIGVSSLIIYKNPWVFAGTIYLTWALTLFLFWINPGPATRNDIVFIVGCTGIAVSTGVFVIVVAVFRPSIFLVSSVAS